MIMAMAAVEIVFSFKSLCLCTAADVPCDLPATMSCALATLSPAMRRRIYEYCVDVARSSNASSHIAVEELMLLEDTKCTIFVTAVCPSFRV